MQLLDRLLKDIVTESENFEIESFMPLLGERIYVSNPFSRQFLVGWIATLDSVPDIELLQHLPIFFDGLFHMLADPTKEIRTQTFSVLQEFLQEIRDAESIAYAPIVHVLVQHSASQDKFSRLSAISWLDTFVSHGREQILPFCAQVTSQPLVCLLCAQWGMWVGARRRIVAFLSVNLPSAMGA
jgi:vacuole morphology and inheritance protein 14